MRVAWRCHFCVLAFATICCLPAIALGETVRTIDDQSTTGTIKGFESGKFLLQVKPGDKARVKIPLEEIAEVTLRDPIAKPALKAVPQGGGLGGLLGAVFGIGQTQPAARAVRIVRRGRIVTAEPSDDSDSADNAATPAIAAAPVTMNLSHRLIPLWSVEFAVGDRVTTSLDRWSGDRIQLGIDANGGKPLDAPVDRIRAIWSSSAALVKKAKDLDRTAEGQDVAFVEKDGDVKAVAGVATGIDGGFLKFKFENEDHRIKLDRVVGILLAQREVAPEKSLFEAFTLINGDVLSGRIDSIQHDELRLKPLFAGGSGHVDIPLKNLAMIDVKNGRLAWLGDLQPSAVVQVPYFDRLMPYRVNQSLTGGALALADGPVSKGIAVHSKCTLTYDIGGGSFERFRVKVGFQQPEGKAGQAALRILGDGKVLWQQPELRGDASQPIAVDLNVAKIQSLSLVADYGATFDVAGRIVWGEARLIKAAH